MKYLIFIFLFSHLLSAHETTYWMKIPPTSFKLEAWKSNDQEELQQLRLMKEDNRTDKLCQLAVSQKTHSFESLYNNRLVNNGPSFAEKKLAALMEKVVKFSSNIGTYFKNQFKRKRPFLADPSLKPCIEMDPKSPSYPSSHAIVAATTSCLLTSLYPEQGEALKNYGIFVGKLRNIVGVHYPSDVQAGYQLGLDICKRLLQDISFQNEMKSLSH